MQPSASLAPTIINTPPENDISADWPSIVPEVPDNWDDKLAPWMAATTNTT